jgi:type IV pilus biogenesis protein CpaD/CtpE
MTTTEPAPRQVAVKVSPEGDRLITSGAHYLRMSKKDLVEAAVEFYLNARREEMQAGMRDLLSQLDGSRAARVAMLAGMTREELEAVGGVQEDD